MLRGNGELEVLKTLVDLIYEQAAIIEVLQNESTHVKEHDMKLTGEAYHPNYENQPVTK
jgi:hypothetical protein